jgi:hypothetical protein
MSRAKHGCDFEIIERSPDNTSHTWLASCACGTKWSGPTYEVVEDKWREHYHVASGVAPSPFGHKAGRWTP